MNSIRGGFKDMTARANQRRTVSHLVEFIIGAVVFGTAHAFEVTHWSDWFNGAYEPWFLNSGRAVLFTLGLLWIASALTTAFGSSPRKVWGLAMCGGAFVAMAVVLFTGPGPGALFPITLGAGGVSLFGSTLAGALAGTAISVALAKRRANAAMTIDSDVAAAARF